VKKFMFRQNELARILGAWADGDSVLLVGIRRTGKTILMKEALRLQEATDKTKVKYIDVADYTRLHDFYRDLLVAMPSTLMDSAIQTMSAVGSVPNSIMAWVRGHVGKVEISGLGKIELQVPIDEAQLNRYWEPIVSSILKALEDEGVRNAMPVLAIDELPFMLENLLQRGVPTQEITVGLASLRKLRDAGLRMIVAGSISLENLLTLHKIPHTVLGGLRRETLPPFSRAEAFSFLQNKLGKLHDASVLDTVLDQLPDYVPHFLDECVHYIRVCKTTNDINLVMQTKVLPAIRRSFLTQFEERLLKNYLPDERICADALLDQLAQASVQGGNIDTTKLPLGHNKVLTKLKFDMFVEEAPDLGYKFTLQLLRQWWRSTRGMPKD
jgi:hypothetical protein